MAMHGMSASAGHMLAQQMEKDSLSIWQTTCDN
jgi:hypothetical protein